MSWQPVFSLAVQPCLVQGNVQGTGNDDRATDPHAGGRRLRPAFGTVPKRRLTTVCWPDDTQWDRGKGRLFSLFSTLSGFDVRDFERLMSTNLNSVFSVG